MPGDDLFLDDSGQYVMGPDGDWVTTRTAQPSVRHQAMDELDAWVGDPEAGRRLVGINGRSNTIAEAERERDSMAEAFEKLEDAGLIADIEIEIDRDPSGRIGLETRSRDTQSGGTIDVSTLDKFGV